MLRSVYIAGHTEDSVCCGLYSRSYRGFCMLWSVLCIDGHTEDSVC